MKKSPENDVIKFYEKDASRYDSERFSNTPGMYVDQIQKDILFGFTNSLTNNTVLDLGCGTGRFSIELAKSKTKVISFDASISMLKLFKNKIRDTKLNIDLVNGSGFQLPFKDNTFDGCVCINVLDHIYDPERLIKEISRVLKKNGFLIINFSNLYSIYLPIALYINLTKKSVQNEVYTEWISLMKIKKIFKKSCLEISDMKGQLVFPKNPNFHLIINLLKKLNIYFINSPLRYASGSVFVMGLKNDESLS